MLRSRAQALRRRARDRESPGAKEAIRLTAMRRAILPGLIALILILVFAGAASASPIADKKARLQAVQAQLETVYDALGHGRGAVQPGGLQAGVRAGAHRPQPAAPEDRRVQAGRRQPAPHRARPPGLQGGRSRHRRRSLRVAHLRRAHHPARHDAADGRERRRHRARRHGLPPGDRRSPHRSRGGPPVGGQAGGAARGEQGPGARAAGSAGEHRRRPQGRYRAARGEGRGRRQGGG